MIEASRLEQAVRAVLQVIGYSEVGTHFEVGRPVVAISLVEVAAGNIVVLRFGGGCHGCGMVDVTLKNGVEKTLRERIPEITEVRDVTDHETGEKPYFAKATG